MDQETAQRSATALGEACRAAGLTLRNYEDPHYAQVLAECERAGVTMGSLLAPA